MSNGKYLSHFSPNNSLWFSSGRVATQQFIEFMWMSVACGTPSTTWPSALLSVAPEMPNSTELTWCPHPNTPSSCPSTELPAVLTECHQGRLENPWVNLGGPRQNSKTFFLWILGSISFMNLIFLYVMKYSFKFFSLPFKDCRNHLSLLTVNKTGGCHSFLVPWPMQINYSIRISYYIWFWN